MEQISERRKEQRLRYHWPVWFAEDFNEILFQGHMVDVSSDGAAFNYNADENCPYYGQQLTARFSVPCFGPDESFDMANFARTARVSRIDNINNFMRKIVVQFTEPLPFKPGEQAFDEYDTVERLKAVTI